MSLFLLDKERFQTFLNAKGSAQGGGLRRAREMQVYSSRSKRPEAPPPTESWITSFSSGARIVDLWGVWTHL
jgi:hypothetical protein